MRSLRVGLLLVGLAAACGEGKAIFNVDVLSFLSAENRDTLPYIVPGGTSGNVDLPAVEATMFGLAADQLDSVIVTVAADVENAAGAGSIAYQIFFGPDSATVYQPQHLYAADTAIVSGVDTVPLAPPPITVVGDSVFANQSVWVGVRAAATANAGPPMSGTIRLTVLDLRIVADVKTNP